MVLKKEYFYIAEFVLIKEYYIYIYSTHYQNDTVGLQRKYHYIQYKFPIPKYLTKIARLTRGILISRISLYQNLHKQENADCTIKSAGIKVQKVH